MRVGRIGEEGKTEIREKKKKSYPIVGFKHGVHKKKSDSFGNSMYLAKSKFLVGGLALTFCHQR